MRVLIRRAFSETSDPDAYLPREATEAALREIGAWADSDDHGSTLAALVGTPGLGKTLLLRLIETRAVRTTHRPAALYLPYAGLTPEDLCVWIYGLLGEPVAPSELSSPETAMELLLGLGAPENPFFILFDDADAMPAETVEAFLEHIPRDHSPLRVLLALNPDSKATRLLSYFHSFSPPAISFRDRMTDEEAEVYLRGRMRWAGFPQVEIDSIGLDEARRLNAMAAGIPRQLHRWMADRFEAEDSSHPMELTQKQLREGWMGQPIDDDLDV